MSNLAETTSFPPVTMADEDGLLMFGGELSVSTLIEAYRQGIFPWPIVDGDMELLSWWSPDPRAIVPLEQFHASRRVLRRIRRNEFNVTFDMDFPAVITACASPRCDEGDSWITEEIENAYAELYATGFAHSVEVWQHGQLVGGLYGVAIGGFFSGESMFHRVTDASKVALFHLVQRLVERGFTLFDIQQSSPHMERMGAVSVPRRRFLRKLRAALKLPVTFA